MVGVFLGKTIYSHSISLYSRVYRLSQAYKPSSRLHTCLQSMPLAMLPWSFLYFYACISFPSYSYRGALPGGLAGTAGVLLGRVSVTTLRAPSVRQWGMGIVHPLGRTFFLSPVFYCLKNSRWRQNFTMWALAQKNLACSAGYLAGHWSSTVNGYL